MFSTCSQACKNVGLDLSAVFREPIIEGKPQYVGLYSHSPLTLILKLSGALSAFHEGPYLGPPGGGDIVDSDMGGTQDDAGAFIASLKIRRFWARVNVSVVVRVEFVAFGRPM